MFGKGFFRRKTAASPAKDSVNATAVALTQSVHTPIVDTSLIAASTLTRKVDDNTVGPLGLSLVYSPVEEPTADFIFVHGLGGGSRKTWSKTPSPNHFWPEQWLPLEPAFQKVRIHTYGYSCDWTERNLDICNVHDFGKGLLSEISTSPLLADAETPLVLVGHSMGGLVIKKAYILARQNALYRAIAKRFHTIYFLATPHRGSDSAQLLNNLLRVAGLSRAYIADLRPGSLNSQSINDEFRQYSGDVQLWSFYELRKTSAGIFNALIVDPKSATLGYDEERQTPMDANHRSICKFDSPTDPNYRKLIQSFSITIRDTQTPRLELMDKQKRDQLKRLEQYLMVPESPENDLIALQDTRAPGTCNWLLSREKFTQWLDFSSHGPTLFWLRGQPGGGKSTLASHVINHLQKASQQCSYFFFKGGDKSKTRLSDCLRSLAFQMGLADPRVLEKLLHMRNEGIGIDGDDFRSLWHKVFEAGVLTIAPSAPKLYWVIDGLDECTSDGSALSLFLLKLEDATSLRVFITSRESEELECHAQRLHIHDGRTYCERLSPSDTLADMDTLVRTRMETGTMRDERDRAALGAKILTKSNGSFLWSVLVLGRMTSVHGKEQVNKVLDEVPSEMESLYIETLEKMSRMPENKPLAKAILTWATCAVRPLTIHELNGALALEMKDEFPNIRASILALCGQLVQVDKAGVVHMVHETAREFLLSGKSQSELAINNTAAHTHLATACFAALCSKEMKPPRTHRRGPGLPTPSLKSPFVAYACEAFSDHLALSDPNNTDPRLSAHNFLGANVLSWIEVIAQRHNLRPLISAAKNFERYLAAAAAIRSPVDEATKTMRSWATDLVRIAAKFGDAILISPSAIHWTVPPFCPTETAVYKAASPNAKLTIIGLHDTQWDDRVANLHFHHGQAVAMCHGGDFFAVALNDGSITLYHAISCQEYMVLKHPEDPWRLEFDARTKLLASAGHRNLCVWNARSGELIHSFALGGIPMTLCFEGDILLALDITCHISRWSMTDGSVLPHRRWYDSVDEDDAAPACRPCAVSISLGHRMIAVAYDGRPITLWDLEEESFHRFCGKRSMDTFSTPSSVKNLVLNPNEDIPRLVVTYNNNDVMLLDPFRDEVISCFRHSTHALAASPDGRLVAGSSSWAIHIYDFETLDAVYRVVFAPWDIRGLAFSRDGMRFLAMQRSECNVWEPTILGGSDISDPATPPKGFNIDFTGAAGYWAGISAMVVHPRGEYAICGKRNGSLTLYDMETGAEIKDLYKCRYLIFRLGWWDKGQVLICIDASNTVTAWKLGKHPNDGWDLLEMLFQARMDPTDAILQLHVSQASGKFVISTRGADHLWSIDGQQHEKISSNSRSLRTWIDHPQSPGHLICQDRYTIRVVPCEGWSEKAAVHLPVARVCYQSQSQIKGIFSCSERRKLLVELSNPEGLFDLSNLYARRKTSDIAVVDTPPFQWSDASLSSPNTPSTSPIEANVVGKNIHIIGVSGDRFIFVDKHSWVCSAEIGNKSPLGETTYIRHFFVPHEWLPDFWGISCQIVQCGTTTNVVFVRHDGLVIVRNVLGFSERVRVLPE